MRLFVHLAVATQALALLALGEPYPGTPKYLNDKSRKFVVNGKKIPDVAFDVGESYAGLMPISNMANETRQLYFWFFPKEGDTKTDDILIWLNGGPGCSSLTGLLNENGPFQLIDGTLAPVKNPYSWHKLTNMVWVEQPVGTGFSQGEPNISNEIELAAQFRGFWENFVRTFQLQGSKIHLAGESYAGVYVPYIANDFLEQNDTTYFDVKGIAVNNPIVGNAFIQQQVFQVPFFTYWANALGLDHDTISRFQELQEQSGYADYFAKHFTFPPPHDNFLPSPGFSEDLDDFVSAAVEQANPCFNAFHITDSCPLPFSYAGPLPGMTFVPTGGKVYFQRKDVQKAINAPPIGEKWNQCNGNVFLNGRDKSLAPAVTGVLTSVVEKTHNVMIGSGALDSALPTNGTLFVLQNMTWSGVQGFQEYPTTSLFVPDHNVTVAGGQGSSGNVGVWRQERGLTFYEARGGGHQLPRYAPSAAYRMLQVLLGHVPDFSSTMPLF
ncbi:hypothetical protein NQ176_g4846 [Zarea fungicola]|uniref:Uncharacterized protein n=1 Tax=Zarea fungicola TaxID=93591 RepID=A0ACC1NC67_9HYPO|nr:hypothetical protein NQ176_g4846 [Lecanicillium fungicola]